MSDRTFKITMISLGLLVIFTVGVITGQRMQERRHESSGQPDPVLEAAYNNVKYWQANYNRPTYVNNDGTPPCPEFADEKPTLFEITYKATGKHWYSEKNPFPWNGSRGCLWAFKDHDSGRMVVLPACDVILVGPEGFDPTR